MCVCHHKILRLSPKDHRAMRCHPQNLISPHYPTPYFTPLQCPLFLWKKDKTYFWKHVKTCENMWKHVGLCLFSKLNVTHSSINESDIEHNFISLKDFFWKHCLKTLCENNVWKHCVKIWWENIVWKHCLKKIVWKHCLKT